jgi:hypothetical protein
MSGVKVNNGVINYGGIPSQGAGLLANRPAAGVLGRLFIGTDTNAWYRDTGSAWVLISAGVNGSAAAGQLAFWGTATTKSGDNALFWDNINKKLGVGTSTPVATLDVNGGFRVPGIGSNVNPVSAGTIPTYLRFLSTGADLYVGTEGITAGGFFTGSGAYDSVFYSSTAINLIIGGVSQMKILPTSGFVGIGYTAPAAKLAVSGSVLINTNTLNALYELFVNGNTYTGGLSPTIATQATSVAMTRTQTGYVCTATLTLTLPAVSGLNNFYIVVANTGATVTVQRAGSDTILDKLGVSQTSVIVAAGTRSMFYVGGGSITYQIF